MDEAAFPVLEALRDPRFAADPGPAFAAAHAEGGLGVFRHPYGGGLVVTGYDALARLSRHPDAQAQDRAARVSGPSQAGALARLFDNHPVFMNEPAHKPAHQAAYRAVGWRGPDQIADLAEDGVF